MSSVESITLGGQDQEAALGGIIEETFRPFSGARVGLHPEESVPLALGSLTLFLLLIPALLMDKEGKCALDKNLFSVRY